MQPDKKDKKQNFYITTPIYYGNGLPHIGHFYSSIIANVIYKYNKISGNNSRFTTGIDENSQKAVIKAEEAGMDIMDYLDNMALEHKKVWDYFNLDYTDFIRTTSDRHHEIVSEVLNHCFESGDIYKGEYEGMYCVGCEAFKKDDDLIEIDFKKVCPDHLKEPDKIKEENYFFTLSKYETWIKEFYDKHPSFVEPNIRFNEVRAFVNRGLEDFSISRETNTFGIPLPFDKTHVTYVWFDALFNYYTSCKKSRAGDKNNDNYVDESSFWIRNENNPGKIVHVVGKDIIRFHAIFWPAMLASYFDLGEEKDGVIHFKDSDLNYLPDTILTGGFFTVDGQKMSKSLGNIIEPVEYSKKYSKELLTLYMLSAFNIGFDGDYDRKEAILNYNAKLANNLGNLVNRVVVLNLKLEEPIEYKQSLKDALASDFGFSGDPSINLSSFIKMTKEDLDKNDLKNCLKICFYYLDCLNKFADIKEPWKTIKDKNKLEETEEVLYVLCEGLRQVGLVLYSFFPEKMGEMFDKLGLEGYVEKLEAGGLEELIYKEKVVFNITKKGDPLFARIDLD